MVKIAAEEGIVGNRDGFGKRNNLCQWKNTASKNGISCELCSAKAKLTPFFAVLFAVSGACCLGSAHTCSLSLISLTVK